jgi:mRNA-degrading endonuclease RelE of RelBE toxin-antitoxin system
LQNEIEFKQRAEKILKHYHGQDQKIFEEKLMNEQQKYINAIISDMEGEIDKESKSYLTISMKYEIKTIF